MTWAPIYVLPNIPLDAAIGCNLAVLAPAHDERVTALKRAHPNFRAFLRRFTDNFGEKFEPCVLLLHASAPESFRHVSPIASFRDAVAIAAISHARAHQLSHPHGMRVLFGEAFAIYPWMLDRDFEDIIGSTPALLGTHLVSSFKGQSSPSVFRTNLNPSAVDQPLLDALLICWRRRYEAAEPEWKDIALMRSLNMAYQASLLPAGTEATFYDVGRILSLWVSAFEILVHPGGNGIANRDKVFDLIEQAPWLIRASRDLAHDTGPAKKLVKRTLASWLYQKLNDSRNDFLHGNPVERESLVLEIPQRGIFEYAAPLYRIALTAFLPLVYDRPQPSADEPSALGAWLADRMTFTDPQRSAEAALQTALQPPLDQLAGHTRVTRPAPQNGPSQ